MALRTYGDKPISFQIEEGGDFYCVGSEVFNYVILEFSNIKYCVNRINN